jgi:hypothetical protein
MSSPWSNPVGWNLWSCIWTLSMSVSNRRKLQRNYHINLDTAGQEATYDIAAAGEKLSIAKSLDKGWLTNTDACKSDVKKTTSAKRSKCVDMTSPQIADSVNKKNIPVAMITSNDYNRHLSDTRPANFGRRNCYVPQWKARLCFWGCGRMCRFESLHNIWGFESIITI